jgi:hypothetical protein
LNAGEKLSGNAAFDLAELELDDYVRHSVKHTLARQIMEAHLEDLDELENEDDCDAEENGDIIYSRDSGKISVGDSVRSGDSGSGPSNRLGPGGLLSQISKRTLFRTQRQLQKKEELRYRMEIEPNNLTKNQLEDEEDPEYAAAKAAVSGVSITADDDGVMNSDTGSLRFASPGGSGKSNYSLSKSYRPPSSHQATGTNHHRTRSDPRTFFAQHISSIEFPRRYLSEKIKTKTVDDEDPKRKEFDN